MIDIEAQQRHTCLHFVYSSQAKAVVRQFLFPSLAKIELPHRNATR